MFADPEFKKLNPAVQPVSGLGAAFQVPTVQSGAERHDLDRDPLDRRQRGRRKFQQGNPTPGACGSTPTTRRPTYPIDAFTARTPTRSSRTGTVPLFPLSLAYSYQAENWDPGTSWEKDQDRQLPQGSDPIPGRAGLIAILDQASAAAFRFPVAEIPNAAGRVCPADQSRDGRRAGRHERATAAAPCR